MRKTMMIGMTLLMMSSCQVPILKDPVEMNVINLRTGTASSGKKDLNIKHDPSKVGEWIAPPHRGIMDEIDPNQTCFPTRVWLKDIKPKLKEGSRAYRDR